MYLITEAQKYKNLELILKADPEDRYICDTEGKNALQHLFENPKLNFADPIVRKILKTASKPELTSVDHDGNTPISTLAKDPAKWGEVLIYAVEELVEHGPEILTQRPMETLLSPIEILVEREGVQAVGDICYRYRKETSKDLGNYPLADQVLTTWARLATNPDDTIWSKPTVDALRKATPKQIFENLTANKVKQDQKFFLQASETEIVLQIVEETNYTKQSQTNNGPGRDEFEIFGSPPEIKDDQLFYEEVSTRATNGHTAKAQLGQPCPEVLGKFLAENWEDLVPKDPELQEILEQNGIRVEKQPEQTKKPTSLKSRWNAHEQEVG